MAEVELFALKKFAQNEYVKGEHFEKLYKNITIINMINRRGIKNGQSRETATIGYTRRRQIKQKHNTRWTPLDENKHK